MGSKYVRQVNPIQDVIMEVLLRGGDIANKKTGKELHDVCVYVLEHFLEDRNDLVYLDFEVVRNDVQYKIIGNNILSALWLSGVIPDNPKMVLSENLCNVDSIQYKFNEKTKKLTYKLRKNNG